MTKLALSASPLTAARALLTPNHGMVERFSRRRLAAGNLGRIAAHNRRAGLSISFIADYDRTRLRWLGCQALP